jgi:class 3 adenylate cyclase/pimeloyl-ACP methyl ester carboxylesterase
MTSAPPIRYAPCGGSHVAYQVIGSGPVDLLVSSYGNASIGSFEDEPRLASFMEALSRFARVIRFDWRGVGLSDPLPAGEGMSARVDDMVAVMDAAGAAKVAVLAWMLTGPPAVLLAKAAPERVSSIVFVNTTARLLEGPGYEFGVPREVVRQFDEEIINPEAEADSAEVVAVHAPSMANDAVFRRWWVESGRRGASPARARAFLRTLMETDVRDDLPSVSVPALVLQRRNSVWFRPEHGEYLAAQLPDARLVWLPGSDMPPFTEGADLVIGEIEEFLTGERTITAPDTALVTVLLTDIVGSTELAASIGDRRFRALLDGNDAVTASEVSRHGGRVVRSTGDGTLAVFDSPARAIRCAKALVAAAANEGYGLRAGVHTGEVEVRGSDVGGVAVHIGERVCATAAGNDVVVSRTVADLVAGGDFDLVDLGEHDLGGTGGAWRLFGVG